MKMQKHKFDISIDNHLQPCFDVLRLQTRFLLVRGIALRFLQVAVFHLRSDKDRSNDLLTNTSSNLLPLEEEYWSCEYHSCKLKQEVDIVFAL